MSFALHAGSKSNDKKHWRRWEGAISFDVLMLFLKKKLHELLHDAPGDITGLSNRMRALITFFSFDKLSGNFGISREDTCTLIRETHAETLKLHRVTF